MTFWPAPLAGDIVWCRFPVQEGISPAHKPRPALVIDVDDARSPVRVRVAYGTSRVVGRRGLGEFAIQPSNGNAFKVSGLSVATKFSFRKAVVLDYDELWFDLAPGDPPGETPVLGILHASLMRRAEAAFTEVHRA